MNTTIQMYDAQADSINLEDITNNEINLIMLSRIRRNNAADSEILYIQNEQEIDLDIGETGEDCIDYIPEGDKDMGWLGYFIGKNNHLKELYFRYVEGMSIDIIKPFVMGLNNNKSITSLDFGRGMDLFDGEIFTMLGPFFENNKNLTNLAVKESNLEDDGWRLLALALGRCKNKSLQRVTLSENDISDGALVDIITALSIQPRLQDIEMADNTLSVNGCKALATLLRNSVTELQHLDLGDNEINDEGMDALVPALKNCNQLQTLRLSRNHSITTKGWQKLATILEAPNSNLRTVFILGNNIDEEALAVFAKALAGNQTLKTLSLGSDASTSLEGEVRRVFTKLICDSSSINSTFQSNHTFSYLGVISRTNPLRSLLALNERDNKKEVAMIKILQHHNDFDMMPFFEWEFKVLPLMIDWFDRASAIPRMSVSFGRRIRRGKLSSIYQFIRGMPLLYVEARLKRELEEIKEELPKLDQRKLLLEERKRSIMERLGRRQ